MSWGNTIPGSNWKASVTAIFQHKYHTNSDFLSTFCKMLLIAPPLCIVRLKPRSLLIENNFVGLCHQQFRDVAGSLRKNAAFTVQNVNKHVATETMQKSCRQWAENIGWTLRRVTWDNSSTTCYHVPAGPVTHCRHWLVKVPAMARWVLAAETAVRTSDTLALSDARHGQTRSHPSWQCPHDRTSDIPRMTEALQWTHSSEWVDS